MRDAATMKNASPEAFTEHTSSSIRLGKLVANAEKVEQTFAAILNSAPDAIVITDADAQIVLVNRQTEQLFGYQREALLGQPVEVLLPERLRELHAQHRATFVNEPHTRPMGVGLDLVARRNDGTEFPVEVSLSPLHTDDGLLITSVIRDVSERKRVEAELRASQARLAGVLEIAEDAIVSVDDTQHIQRFNHGAEATFGYDAAEVIGQHLDMLIPPRFHTAHQQHVRGFAGAPEIARTMGERREIYGLRKDGTEFPAEASISKLRVGDETVFTVILRDTTERKRAADELERKVQQRTAHLNALLTFSKELFGARSLDIVLERALNHALALAPQAECGAIYLVEREPCRLALRASRGFSQLPPLSVAAEITPQGLGFPPGEAETVAGMVEWSALSAGTPSATHELMQVLGLLDSHTAAFALPLVAFQQEVVGVLLLLHRPNFGDVNNDARLTLAGLANLTAAAIVEEHNRQAAATLSSQLAHLEEQQRTMAERLNYVEAGMLQAARLAAVGQLAASIAHEINNPLYAARNGLFLIEEDLPADLRSSPYLQMVSDQLSRIAGIIERMRDFYRPTRGELAPANINQLVEETLALAGLNSRHGGINMLFTPALDLPLVEANADQLRQVFLNLVLNAIDAMPDGGTLTVRTYAGSFVVVVEIEDTGIGIPEDIRPHLFEPFFTNKPNGTGLGLSISAHIVTQHGGQIEVASVPGQGTTFRVVLPYQSQG